MKIEIAVDGQDASGFCEWLNKNGHDASVGTSTGSYVDGEWTAHDEHADAAINQLWDEYCREGNHMSFDDNFETCQNCGEQRPVNTPGCPTCETRYNTEAGHSGYFDLLNGWTCYSECPACSSMAAKYLGRRGGSVKSDKKTAAVRENGKKGGRPRKVVS